MKRIALRTIILLFFLGSCKDLANNQQTSKQNEEIKKDSLPLKIIEKKPKEKFRLTEDNSIEFFFNYQKELKKNKVKISTSLGSFIIQLFDNVPYHKANFIYLTRQGYFNNTQFHRVVKNFIVQGGNSDDKEATDKRRKIGRYLLPPDTKKGYKHHRGIVSMPSSDRNNPHKLASPYEFFIVVNKQGSYHLDNDYTPFGKVIQGMNVVDKINSQPVGKGDWPQQNIYIIKAEIIE